jgi:hypothetical protein
MNSRDRIPSKLKSKIEFKNLNSIEDHVRLDPERQKAKLLDKEEEYNIKDNTNKV